jgi:hypothetical protein
MDDRARNIKSTRNIKSKPTYATDENDEQRVQEIRSDIEQTRDDLSETVDAIQDRLRPSNVMARAASATTEKAKDVAQSAADTAEEWWDSSGGRSLVDHIRAHPVPAAMAGIGLAWLAFSNGRSTNRYSYRTTSGSRIGTQDSMTRARHTLDRERARLETTVQQYPLAVGAAAFIVGMSVGMAVPETERENELLGEARDNAVQRAQEAASGAVERVKEAAAEAVTGAVIGEPKTKRS